MTKLWARFRRWLHLMRWMWEGHRAVTLTTPTLFWRQAEVIMCDCGAIFYESPWAQRSGMVHKWSCAQLHRR